MPEYYVTYKITARFIAAVEASGVDEAMYLAQGRFYDADFGEAEDIEGEVVIVEDENGDFVYEE